MGTIEYILGAKSWWLGNMKKIYVRLLKNNPKIDWIIHLFNRNLLKSLLVQATILHFWIEEWISKNFCPHEASILVGEYRENK